MWDSAGALLKAAALIVCTTATQAHALQVPSNTGYAANHSIDDDLWHLIEQRARFVQAESALKQRDMARFRRLRDELTDYPLYPYLQFADISQRLNAADPAEVEEFLERYSNTPLSWRLRRTWLKSLARRARWEQYLEFYEGPANATMRCQWLRALINAGQADKAMPHVESLWLVGHSQPPACDPVFSAWRLGGYLTRDLVWERIELAVRSGRPSLASYLARFLDAAERPLVKTWLEVRNEPSRVIDVAGRAGEVEIVEAILVYGVERMAQRDAASAAATWERLRTRHAFSAPAVARVHRRIGLSYAYAHQEEALYWLNAIPESELDDRAREWRILSAMNHGEWREALDLLLELDSNSNRVESLSERWHYWTARALENLGWHDDADTIYAELARRRSYYGFLAADRIGEPYRLNHRTLAYSDHELRLLAARPGAMRARELYRLGRTIDARREWRLFTRDMGDEELARAAKLAHKWGWHGRAIMTVARTPHLDDLEMRFPLAYHDRVLEKAEAQRIDPAWMFAIVRQESAFIADARSPAGALGLMQIMPGTGRKIARSLNRPFKHRRQLLDADTSLEFGSTYLRFLLDEMGEHPVLAAAAYNAGPHRVARWRPARRNMSADLWIENVPFGETREYLRRVLTYTTIYEQRLGRDTVRMSDRLTPIPPRDTTLARADVAATTSTE